MSRSLDQSRPFRAGRHRAAAAPVITTPLTPTSSDADVPHPGHGSTEPASAPLRRRRDRRPAIDVPPAPESGRPAETASPATEAIPAIAPMDSAPKSPRRAAGSADAPSTAVSPQVAAAFSSDARAILKRAASVRVIGHRMAIVAGSLAVLLAVGTASQATELPFFGKESSAQDAPGATDATRATSGAQPTYANGRVTPSGAPGTPAEAAPGTGNVPAASDPNASSVPAVADLPMPVDAPTLAGILADSPAAVPPSPGPTVILQPPVISAATTAPPASPAGAAPAPTTTPPATPTTPVAASPSAPPAPSPTGTAAPSDEGDDNTDEAVDTRSYASARLASYGWGADQMTALNALWDTSAKWRPSQVDRGLGYIKERYGSPEKALEFRAENNWY